MRELLQELFQNLNYQPKTFEEIKQVLGVETTEEEKLLKTELEIMLKNYDLFWNKKKTRYLLPRDVNLYKGRIEIARQGYGFIISENFDQDLFVAIRNLKDATHKDEVLFKTQMYQGRNQTEARQEAVVVEVVKRHLEYLIGEVYFDKKRCMINVLDMEREVEVSNPEGLKAGKIVKAKITQYLPAIYHVEVQDILGGSEDIGMDIAMIAAKYDFSPDFRQETIDEVRTISDDLSLEAAKRKKINHRVITIDGEDAKDLDDAVAIQKLDNGHYMLGVYIADVSYFVKEDSALDKEAFARGTSVYLADRVIPMLPKRLSNHLCSLNPEDDKLVLACDMEIDQRGEVLSTQLYEATIRSAHRMTYDKCNQILGGDEESIEEYKDLYPDLILMRELAEILEKRRTTNGALDFDIPEGKVVVDEQGKVLDIQLRSRGLSEKIIESFMIVANESVATTITQLDFPFIYRIHDKPNAQKLELFQSVASNLGYSLKSKGSKINQLSIQSMLQHVKEEDKVINTLLLRMMAKAIYSERNIGHYGLASECYTHFTSPIRRYPDLIVHRLIRQYIIDGRIDATRFLEEIQKIAYIAEHSSKKERDATDCEYEVLDMKKAEYMEEYVGEEFPGIISSITSFGMFIELANTVDGLVRLRDLDQDVFEYDPKRLIVVGKKTKRYFRIGQKVRIQVVSANKKKREIDFKLLYNISELPKHVDRKTNGDSKTVKRPTNNDRLKKGKTNGNKTRRRKK